MHEHCIRKVKTTPELKNIDDYDERAALLKDAFEVKSEQVKGKRILILDDLYRSGAILKAVAQALRTAKPEQVTVIALTRTRVKS